MSWTTLDEFETSSSSGDDEFEDSKSSLRNCERFQDGGDEKRLLPRNTYECTPVEKESKPIVQEPNSENNLSFDGADSYVKSLLARKDEHIGNLQKMLNCQREQIYHFLKMSINNDMLMQLKTTCQDGDSLAANESLSMALDKFKNDNDLPTEQGLIKDDLMATLARLERLTKHQEKLVHAMESVSCQGYEAITEEALKNIGDSQGNNFGRMLLGTKELARIVDSLRIQLKRLGLVEEERLHIIERVYSLPAGQRRYYTHLLALERKKMQLHVEVGQLKMNLNTLQQRYDSLKEKEVALNNCIAKKIENFDRDQVMSGPENNLKLLEMVERGEMSLVAMTKDEKGKFSEDFVKLRIQNNELTERLKDFEKVVEETGDLRKQVKALTESCLELDNELKVLRLELKKITEERNRLKSRIEKIIKEPVSLVVEERDQLRLRLIEYSSLGEDLETLKSKISQAEAYRIEVEELRLALEELDEVKTTHLAASNQNPDFRVSPLDRDLYKDLMHSEILKYKQALLKQEGEIKDLLVMVEQFQDFLSKSREYRILGYEPKNGFLSKKEQKRLQEIRNRIFSTSRSTIQVPLSTDQENQSENVTESKSVILHGFKSLLGFTIW